MAARWNRMGLGLVPSFMSSPSHRSASRPLLFLAGALLGLLAIPSSFEVQADEPVPRAIVGGGLTGPDGPVEAPEPDVTVLGIYPYDGTVIGAYKPPEPATLVPTGGFGAWLQALELEPPSVPVRTHDGREVPGDFHVVKLPLVRGDLQQCADTAIRLRAEWLREQGREDEILFHATSGDPMPWSRYRDGERAREQGNRLVWEASSPASWDRYLQAVFMWAGTRSLAFDSEPAEHPMAGDLLVLPGSPGHAVIILAVSRAAGASYLLVGQGYMPAQSFHIVRGPHAGWWRWDTEQGAEIGPWDFPADSLRRWR
jgi:hypothetical protein